MTEIFFRGSRSTAETALEFPLKHQIKTSVWRQSFKGLHKNACGARMGFLVETRCYQLERTRTDLTVEIEESTDLIAWNPATVSSTATVSDNGSIRTYKAKVPLSGAEKKFLRLKLSALTN
jgi:hypothetical protein